MTSSAPLPFIICFIPKQRPISSSSSNLALPQHTKPSVSGTPTVSQSNAVPFASILIRTADGRRDMR